MRRQTNYIHIVNTIHVFVSKAAIKIGQSWRFIVEGHSQLAACLPSLYLFSRCVRCSAEVSDVCETKTMCSSPADYSVSDKCSPFASLAHAVSMYAENICGPHVSCTARSTL